MGSHCSRGNEWHVGTPVGKRERGRFENRKQPTVGWEPREQGKETWAGGWKLWGRRTRASLRVWAHTEVRVVRGKAAGRRA